MFTKVLDEKLIETDKPVRTYAVHPGFIRSNLYTQTWYAKLCTAAMGFMFKSEADGAKRVVFSALSPTMEIQSGNYFENCQVVKPIALTRNRENQTKLWDISCQLLDIQKFGGL